MLPVPPSNPELPSIPASPISGDIDVEVSYAEPQRSIVKTFRLKHPASIDDALRLAAADLDFAGIDVLRATVGIFGRAVPRREMLNDGDRVEIYRPLAEDPKHARRERVREARKKL